MHVYFLTKYFFLPICEGVPRLMLCLALGVGGRRRCQIILIYTLSRFYILYDRWKSAPSASCNSPPSTEVSAAGSPSAASVYYLSPERYATIPGSPEIAQAADKND